jgi:hypothetical protein
MGAMSRANVGSACASMILGIAAKSRQIPNPEPVRTTAFNGNRMFQHEREVGERCFRPMVWLLRWRLVCDRRKWAENNIVEAVT